MEKVGFLANVPFPERSVNTFWRGNQVFFLKWKLSSGLIDFHRSRPLSI